MFSAISQHDVHSCGGKSASPHGLKTAFPAVLMPWVPDSGCGKREDSTSQLPLAHQEKSGFCCKDGNVEKLLVVEEEGASARAKVPGDPAKGVQRRLLGKLGALHPLRVLVLAVLMAVFVVLTAALTAAVVVLSAGRAEERPAAVLGCPDDWVGHRRVCFYLSTAEGSWDWSQQQCSALGASLVVLRREWEMGFLSRLKGNDDYWLGLRRRGEGLRWVDGSSFNQTFPVHGEAECVYLNSHAVASSSCSQHRPYACSKPQAAMGQG
ncbi:C-type lectin domain family 2 member D-like [Opisthocomus hoazin]|uniref:C-type lectin domain family 2 member D-like n=1 Tax=Opisthocomus hoazin TaxID=30419 RepID=UPI003F53433D